MGGPAALACPVGGHFAKWIACPQGYITERGGKDCKSELKTSVEGKLQNWNFKIKISY
jgi:hypothetical protein